MWAPEPNPGTHININIPAWVSAICFGGLFRFDAFLDSSFNRKWKFVHRIYEGLKLVFVCLGSVGPLPSRLCTFH